MEGPDLHAFEIRAAGADLLCRFSREGHESDLPRARDSGSHGVASFFDHGVRFAGARTSDDDGTILLGQNRLTLLGVQAREGRIVAASREEAPVGSSAFRLTRRATSLVEAQGAHRMEELPPASQGGGELFARLLGFGVPEPGGWFSQAVSLKTSYMFHCGCRPV